MVRWINRAVRGVWVLAVVACAALAARAIDHLFEARAHAESAEPAPPVAAPPPAPAPEPPSKDGSALTARNMFCSDCAPPDDGPIDPPDDGGALPITDLPLALVATSLADPHESSFATLRDDDSGSQGAYWTGDRIPGAGSVERIGGRYVVFRNERSGRLEKIPLVAARESTETRSRAAPQVSSAGSTRPPDPYADRIAKTGDSSWDIERSLVEELLRNPAAIRGARVLPWKDGDEVRGVRLYAVRPTSLFHHMGLKSGDSIASINGYALDNPDAMLKAFTDLKDATNLEVALVRRGDDRTHRYRVR